MAKLVGYYLYKIDSEGIQRMKAEHYTCFSSFQGQGEADNDNSAQGGKLSCKPCCCKFCSLSYELFPSSFSSTKEVPTQGSLTK